TAVGAASGSNILRLVNTVTEGDNNSQTQVGQTFVHETTSSPMLRWQHFRLVLGRFGRDTTNSILLKLTHPTPLLETLEILDWLYNPSGVAMTLDVFSNPAVFPYFNNLTSFSTNFEIEVSHFLHRHPAFTGVSLRSLSVLVKQPTLRHISGYPNLSELRISRGGITPIDSPILFPQIHRLTIEGGSLAWLVTILHAPNLQQLRMSSNLPQQCPTLSLFSTIQSLEWDVPFKPYSVHDFSAFLSTMDEMFHGYPRQIEGAASRSDILELVNAVTEGDDNSQTQFGQNSEHETTSLPMLRWQRFRIVLGRIGQDTTNSILLKLIHPTPLLEKLEILDWLYDPNGVAMTLDVFSNPAVFPYFNNLTSFSTNFEIQISHFLHRNHAFTGVSLRSLSVLANQLTLRHILGYPNLSELRISHGGMTPIDSPILFPQLLRLTIEGGSLAWQVTTVDAPNLQRLRMSSDRPQQCPTSSLFLTIQSLEWDVPFKPYDVRDFSVFLSSVFAQCPRLEDLTVWSLSRSILASSGGEFEGIVERLLKEHPLPSLKSITLLRPRTGDFDHAEVAIVIRPPSPQRR
ncbi:hypothetical protein FRC17_005145, partial [Serendipita sp. 399]